MLGAYTTRLFYRRYTHHVLLNGDMAAEIIGWAKAAMHGKYRKYNRRPAYGQSRGLSVYCNRQQYDQLADRWDCAIRHVTAPFNAEAEQLLLEGLKIDLREKPFYNRYSYVMRFWLHRDRAADLSSFIEQRLGKPGRDYKLVRSRHFPNLYLRDESQLIIMRLADPPARVLETVRVFTHGEVLKAIR